MEKDRAPQQPKQETKGQFSKPVPQPKRPVGRPPIYFPEPLPSQNPADNLFPEIPLYDPKEARRAAKRRYSARHKEELRVRRKDWLHQYAPEYREKNREKLNAQGRERYKQNKSRNPQKNQGNSPQV